MWIFIKDYVCKLSFFKLVMDRTKKKAGEIMPTQKYANLSFCEIITFQVVLVSIFDFLGVSSRKKKTFICDMFRLFGDMSWEVISNTFWKLISVCRDRSYFAMVPIFSQFKVICSMNKLVLWFDLVTQWDVLVFKAAVFSRDTDQIITAQPLLQGYLVLTCSVCLELFWDHFFAHFMFD